MQTDNRIAVISFQDHQIPEFQEVRGDKYVSYGKDNRYPDFLLDLYNRSPKHNAIINGKATYIAGKGFDGYNEPVNRYGEKASRLLWKQTIDLELFGGFYVQVIFNKAGTGYELYHLDYHKMRSDKDNTTFFYKEDGWKNYDNMKGVKTFKAFNPEVRKGSSVLYYKDYRPGLNTYTQPVYIGALSYIQSDIFVADHVLNNSKNGFTASKMLNFFNGEPTEEEKKAIEKGIKDKYTGAKGSKLILSFNNGKDNAPEVLDLGASDLSKENFEHVDKLIEQNIFTGHQVTSPMLFGVKTEGQLGGRNEIRESFEIFMNTYVNAKQQSIEEVWSTITGKELKIVHTEPIGYDVIGNTKIFDMLPERYIFEKIGFDPTQYPELEQERAQKQAEREAAAQPGKFSDDDAVVGMFAEVGVPKQEYIIVKKKKSLFSSQEEIDGHEALAFADINQAEANVLDMVRKDKRITPDALAKALNLPVVYVERLLDTLEAKGLLSSTTEKVGDDEQIVRTPTEEAPKAVEEKKPLTTEVFIKYSYEGPQDERNRDFCAKMMDLDRLYSRAEIEQISQRLGYSVWERRGGFWRHTDGTITPYCRHRWQQNIVIKKK